MTNEQIARMISAPNWNIYNAQGQYVANYFSKTAENALAKYYRDFPGSPRTATARLAA